ncbi:MAG: molybdopterin-dependent oxidoreductase [Dehalococcoidia bacterium]|nr:MAG: molybdopterin-dependent oxidoreductase [Dehalococcoidia bacterium]
MKNRAKRTSDEAVVTTTCASHCGGSCLLKLHVKGGVITRIETDDGEEPQLRGCLRGRAYRQRVYAADRILYPLRRVGERGEGQFERISWDEALDTIAGAIIRVRDTYGPASILYMAMGGDLGNLHNIGQMSKLLALAGGCTMPWGMTSFQAGIYAQRATYGLYNTSNNRDDLLNSRLIIMWGWNPASTISGVNTNWYLAQARESGTKIVVIDPRYTDSAATFAHEWIPICPGTDCAMLLAMAYVMIEENLYDYRFLDRYTFGFSEFRDYVTGKEDGLRKTPAWAEAVTGVPATRIESLAREYATVKPAALMAGIAPGRTAYGEQYHRMAMTLATMTGNIGIHGGDAAGRAWESLGMGYPCQMNGWKYVLAGNPVDQQAPRPPAGSPTMYRASKVHGCDIPGFIERGKAGGYPADCKLIAVTNCSFVNAFPDVNRLVQALKSGKLEFMFILEQYMTPTVKFADIVLPNNTFVERNDTVNGVGLTFYGYAQQAIESAGESKSQLEIVSLLASRLGISDFVERTEEEWLRLMVSESEIPDYDEFKKNGLFRIELAEPYVALKTEIEDPDNNPLPTPSGKIEIYSQRWAQLGNPDIPPLPRYIETWEGRNDPLIARYPLQLITSHHKRRANNQFDNIPWLRELEPQSVMMNRRDALARGISNGDLVRIFNNRGEMIIPASVTERIMPGVVDVPYGAWYDPDENGVDRGGCANVLTKAAYSPGGAYTYNTCLVEIQKT